MAGYSTSESKLSELKDGKFKSGFKFTVSKTAEAYETVQRKKNAILVALSFAKNKGGGEASRQSLIDYLDQLIKEQDSYNSDVVFSYGSIFDPRNPLTKL